MSTVASLGLLSDLAEAQAGLLTARQAEEIGVPRRDLTRLAQSGSLEHVAYGVYRVAGAPRPRFLELRAAWLQLAPGVVVDRRTVGNGVVSHASAALVHGVGLLEPMRYEFTVPPPRRMRSRRNDVAIHQAPLHHTEIVWTKEILATTPARLVNDLAAQNTDGDHLAGVVADVWQRSMATRRELISALAPHTSRYGQFTGGSQFLDHLLSTAS